MPEGKKWLKYVGPHAAVEVLDDAGTVHVVERGKRKSFPSEVADSLAEQSDWEPSSRPKSQAKDATDESSVDAGAEAAPPSDPADAVPAVGPDEVEREPDAESGGE